MSSARAGLALALGLGTLAVFGTTAHFEFVHFDDHRYVVTNPWIADGLSLETFRWAVSSFHFSNWHPLTWLSYALDVTLFGVDPAGFHAMNVAFHLANTLLVFQLFDRGTRDPWASAGVAALFAWHPLHVEAVAWVAERKELIAAFFGLLACLGWIGWTRRGGRVRYAAVVLCMALSLMAKPMWVTLPLLLLVLDHWPLSRLTEAPLRRLVEKLPLLALSVLSCLLTLSAQGRALETGAQVPLAGRLANALVSPVRYLAATVWPVDLSVLVPHPYLPGGVPFATWQVAGCALLLALFAWLALRSRERPYAIAGLAWFAIALSPVIGLVQVGEQAMADRYTYVPLLGVFFLLAFGMKDIVGELRERNPSAARLAVAAVAAVLLLFALRSVDQVGAWRDTITLYERSLEATPNSATLRSNLGNRLLDVGREREAILHFEAARALRPGWVPPTQSLAWLLATSDDPGVFAPARALALAKEAVAAVGESDPNTLDTLAAAHAAVGDHARAEAVEGQAVRLAQAAGATAQARSFEQRRRLYAEGRAYREPLRPGEVTSKSAVR